MFKQAVDSHRSSQPPRKITKLDGFLSSSPPTARNAMNPPPHHPPNGTRPLHNGSGNITRPSQAPGFARHAAPSIGSKRMSSGLAKALVGQDNDFENAALPPHNSRQNPIYIHNSPTKNIDIPTLGVEFDENDFDSDIDLDEEDPATKATLSYPKLPAVPDRPNMEYGVMGKPDFLKSQLSGQAVSRNAEDSGYETQISRRMPGAFPAALPQNHTIKRDPQPIATTNPPHVPSSPPPLNSSQPLPWSSSPEAHFKTPTKVTEIRKYGYVEPKKTAQEPEVKAEPKPRPKRRTIPWLEQQKQQQQQTAKVEADPTSTPRRGQPHKDGQNPGEFTPLPKDSAKNILWNTTASAVKQQQQQMREVNKKKSRTNEATQEERAEAKKRRTRLSKIFLSEEQQHVMSLVIDHKKSVFFTGSAGTGKSVLLREIISSLRKKYAREIDRVAVTASTGLAACNIGGVTLHSFAGIGLGKEPAEELVKKIRKNQKARHRWMRTKILVIDEVSMVDGELFDKLEQVARTLRNNGRPFGGIQLVITGDFFQLPPVPESGRLARFAFDAGTWNTSIEHTIGLHHVFRQKDPVFANMLNEMREGRLSQKSISAFRSLDRKLDNFDDLEATELFPTRQEVDRANQVRMQNLHGVTQTFEARDGGTVTDKTYRDKMLANCMAPEYIHLKKGAQVMLIKNLDDTLVNGSLGKVIGFMSEQTFDKYTEDEEGVMAAQAVTEGGEPGIAGNIAPSDIKSKSKSDLLGTNTSQIYPVVRFVLADNTTRDLLCQRETWKIELPNGEVQASRAQIPLILAWALSIHKAQGQTLERVKVDLGKVFEKGQAYVALSRATAMAGLQVLRFDPKKVMAHERVRVFYSSLTRAEQAGGGVTKAKPEKKKKGKLGFSAIEYEKRVAGNSDDDEDARAALRDH